MLPPIHSIQAWAFLVEERVAIMTVDGGVPEAEALASARAWYGTQFRRTRREHQRSCIGRGCLHPSVTDGLLERLDASAKGRPGTTGVTRAQPPQGRQGSPSLEECHQALVAAGVR